MTFPRGHSPPSSVHGFFQVRLAGTLRTTKGTFSSVDVSPVFIFFHIFLIFVFHIAFLVLFYFVFSFFLLHFSLFVRGRFRYRRFDARIQEGTRAFWPAEVVSISVDFASPLLILFTASKKSWIILLTLQEEGGQPFQGWICVLSFMLYIYVCWVENHNDVSMSRFWEGISAVKSMIERN